jgi:hypothetical protein
MAIEEKWDAANMKGDAATLGTIFADNFISTNTDGKVRSRAKCWHRSGRAGSSIRRRR